MIATGALLALLAALGYSTASVFLKSALERGATAAQVNCLANVAMAILVQPLWFFDRPDLPNAVWWQPLISCGTFYLGQFFTFAALSRGDVSVVTPLLGMKIVLVTMLNAFLFNHPVPGRWWIAAVIGTVSVALISHSIPRQGRTGHWLRPVIFSLAAASFFSLTDVLVQHWGGGSDPLAYMPAMFGMVGLMSAAFYGATARAAFRPVAASRRVLGIGVTVLAIQAGAMFLALTWSQDATGANILYTTRSVWSILGAWFVGSSLGLHDRESGSRILFARLAGALLLLSAILLILL